MLKSEGTLNYVLLRSLLIKSIGYYTYVNVTGRLYSPFKALVLGSSPSRPTY
jgi:hypothetical protein